MRRVWWVIGGFFFGLVLILGLIAVREGAFTQKVWPDFGRVAPVTLTDALGQPFSLDSLRGKVWVASFFFSRCTTVCPAQNQRLLSLYRSYELDPRVRLISVSVDPVYDTPAVLLAYQQRRGVQSKKWTFLTGSPSQVTSLSEDVFKLAAKTPDFHSTKVALVDGAGIIRGYYDLQMPDEVRRLFKEIALLAAQSPSHRNKP